MQVGAFNETNIIRADRMHKNIQTHHIQTLYLLGLFLRKEKQSSYAAPCLHKRSHFFRGVFRIERDIFSTILFCLLQLWIFPICNVQTLLQYIILWTQVIWCRQGVIERLNLFIPSFTLMRKSKLPKYYNKFYTKDSHEFFFRENEQNLIFILTIKMKLMFYLWKELHIFYSDIIFLSQFL